MLILGKSANPEQVDYPELGKVREVFLTDEARKQGTYVVGTTGTGKTTLLLNLIHQDMKRTGSMGREGICVLDPHGDFTEDILRVVPKSREQDVILFDPTDTDHPLGLNLLDCDRTDMRERDLVVSAVVDTLQKLFMDSWGPRMEDLLRHSILSLLLHDEPTTLLELMLVLANQEHRERLTKRAREQDPVIKAFWEDQFDQYDTRQRVEVVGSSLNKIGRFLANPMVRHIVAQSKSLIDFKEAMREGKILLINLAKGALGADNSTLLGSVIVNQVLIAALSRKDQPVGERRPFHLYVDEYQTFATKTFPELQSEARKYAIDTIVAHQYRDQLDLENQGSTLNVANLLVLRVSGKDALELAPQFDLTPLVKRVEKRRVVDIGDGIGVEEVSPGTGTPLYRFEWQADQTYSDSHLEVANRMAQLPNRQALCRVLMPREGEDIPKNLFQFRIDLAKPSLPDKDSEAWMEAEARAGRIVRAAQERAVFTEETIRQYIREKIFAVDDTRDFPRDIWDVS